MKHPVYSQCRLRGLYQGIRLFVQSRVERGKRGSFVNGVRSKGQSTSSLSAMTLLSTALAAISRSSPSLSPASGDDIRSGRSESRGHGRGCQRDGKESWSIDERQSWC